MKVLERVKVADLHTPRDGYGNEFPSREFDAQVNIDYVQELADSFNSSGEPDVALSLVRRDEGGYYVADGQSRLHAMQLRGTSECWGVIDEDATVQDVIETIMRTNKKKKYEPAEESRVVQQLAAFGDDAYVSEVASIDVDNARRVRKAREMIGEKAEQLSLDRLYAVSDFEGDEDAVSKIIEAREDAWRRVADDLHREKERQAQRAAFTAAARDNRITLLDSRPTYGKDQKRYICECTDPKDIMADYMAASVDYKGIVGWLEDGWRGVVLNFYGDPLKVKEESPEEAERRRLVAKYERIAERIDDDVFNWMLEQFEDCDEVPANLRAMYEACEKIARNEWAIRNAFRDVPLKPDDNCITLFIIGYQNGIKRLERYVGQIVTDNVQPYSYDSVSATVEWLELHMACGWQPDEEEDRCIELVREKVAAFKDEADAETDEEDDYDEEDE